MHAQSANDPKESGLLSLEQGHPSMGKMAFGEKGDGRGGKGILLKGGGEFDDLLARKSLEKTLEEDDAFAEAGIEVVMGAIEDAPFELRLQGGGILEFRSGIGEGLFEVLDEVNEGGDFVKELRALTQQDAAAKVIKTGGAAAFWILKILWIQRIDAGRSAEVFGVRKDGAKNQLHIAGKAFAECR